MKVYELMAILEKVPAGAEVKVGMCATLTSEVVETDFNESDGFTITGGDAEVIDTEGNSIGYLSSLAEVEEA